MVFAARAGHYSLPRCSMMPMAALERFSYSVAVIICVVWLVLGGLSAGAVRRVARHAERTLRGSWGGCFVKPLPCAFPTRADDQNAKTRNQKNYFVFTKFYTKNNWKRLV